MIEHVERTEREKEEEINKKEEEIRQNLAKQEAEIKAWQKRVEGRNVYAERERLKRRQILDEVIIIGRIQFLHIYLDIFIIYIYLICFDRKNYFQLKTSNYANCLDEMNHFVLQLSLRPNFIYLDGNIT